MLMLIKLLQDHNYVHATLAFGTYSSIFLAKLETHSEHQMEDANTSPVPWEKTLFLRPLPFDGVQQMFEEWAKENEVLLAEGLMKEIYGATEGYVRLPNRFKHFHDRLTFHPRYAGIVGWAGRSLEDLLGTKVKQGEEITVAVWVKYCRDKLPQHIYDSYQYSRLVRIIEERLLLPVLLGTVLSSPGPYTIPGIQFV
jgi:hypothetical protein